MPRYIDADIAVAQIIRLKDNDSSKYDLGLDTAINEIKHHIPTADVVERRRGKWLYLDGLDAFECSVCGRQMVRNIFDYCPWCGAEMRERRTDDDRNG